MNNFEQHWDKNSAKEIPATKRVVAQQFLQPFFDYQASHSHTLVLDAGCGDGVHIEAIAGKANALASSSLIGLDISMSALQASRQRRQPHCMFVRGDVGKLPFIAAQFDVVFSFGVLAYTDNPYLSFSELCRVTRPGGYVGVWVYPKTGGLGGILFWLVRKACQVTGPIGCRLIADFIVPFLAFLPTRSKVSLANASWRQCREVVLVNIAPDQLHFPALSEVEDWFAKNNLTIISRDEVNPITLWGMKC